MSRYKLCPSCKAQNDPRSLECSECQYDLTGVPITDSEVIGMVTNESMPPEVVPAENLTGTEDQGEPSTGNVKTTEESSPLVRVCSCGEINPPQLRKCQKCHEDISDILPTPRPVKRDVHFQLEEIGGTGRMYQLPCGSMLIGRENGLRECLGAKPYVSRTHARLTVENGLLYIENLSATNYTYVNNVKIPAGKTQLKLGDELGLGGIMLNGQRQSGAAYFLVGIVS